MIVTISRQLGSEGDLIAARVAAALGLLLVDREYICKAALAAGLPAALLQNLMYEGQHSLAGQIMDSLGSTPSELTDRPAPSPGPLEGIFTPMLAPSSINLEDGVRSIGRIITEVARQDDVLVLGQGGQVWLSDRKDACHVQVVAPYNLRIERVATRENLSRAAGRRRVRASDQARAEYLARYHGVNWLDPLLYHYVINTGRTSADIAASLIIHAAQMMRSEA
jgi:Cytidylate kinase-like family